MISQDKNERQPLYFKQKAPTLKIDPNEILWVESIGGYLSIHTEEERFTVSIALKELHDLLGSEGFIQVSRNCLVAKDKISSMSEHTIVIGSNLIPVGKTFKKAVQALV